VGHVDGACDGHALCAPPLDLSSIPLYMSLLDFAARVALILGPCLSLAMLSR
jgi:hypothetical protein